MARNFDLHVSVQFKGGQYFESFSANSYEDFEQALRDVWYATGLSISTGEIFIYTSVDLKDGPYNFMLGYYKVEGDNETIIGISPIPEPGSPEHIICSILNVDVYSKSLRYDEEELFKEITQAIVKHQKSWAELSRTIHRKIEKLIEDLDKKYKQRLKADAFYQCASCDWVGAAQERLVRYFDFNNEPCNNPNQLRDLLNSGPNQDQRWLKSNYHRLCPKCLGQTKITESGEALFTSAMQKREMSYDKAYFDVDEEFSGKKNAQKLARIDLCYGNEEARICCNPSKLYESIRFRKLTDVYEKIMASNNNGDLFSRSTENVDLTQLFDQLYKEVFFENLHYGE